MRHKSFFPFILGVFSDIRLFFIKRPAIPTLVEYETEQERLDYCERIMQRLEIDVEEYSVVNIHKIGIDIPIRYVFEELMKWDGKSAYWPNHLANVSRINGHLDELDILLLGLEKIGFRLFGRLIGFRIIPLFVMKALRFKLSPDPNDVDNARYFLYRCSGGYPIGIFSIYVRSSILEQQEKEMTQLFSLVAFNFFGRKNWFLKNLVNNIWELIHNRATANILNRIKQSYERKFQRALNNPDLMNNDTKK